MTARTELIWDLPTRLIHWVIAGAVFLNLFYLEEGDEPHQWVGYVALAAFLIRFVWGFCGAEHSRFRSFPLAPREIIAFSLSLIRRKPIEYSGHNPLASLVYIAIWGCIVGLGVTGWMMGWDRYWGEEWLEQIHVDITNVLKGLLILHFLGIIIDAILHHRKSWMAMINGRKPN